MGRVGVTVIYSQLLVVVVATHRDNVLVVGGEGDAVDAVLVPRELGHAALSVLKVPDPDRGKMSALPRHQIPTVLRPEKLKIIGISRQNCQYRR